MVGLSILAIAAGPSLAAHRHVHKKKRSDHAVQTRGPMKLPGTQLEPIAWSDLDGWAEDDHAAAFATFLTSCGAVVHGFVASRKAQRMHAALAKVCRRALAAGPLDAQAARQFFEANFRPVRISRLGEAEGFLTGYY